MTRALDIDCPNQKRTETVRVFGVSYERQVGCGALAGRYCNGQGIGVDLCQERINEAARITRAKRTRRRTRIAAAKRGCPT